jgi:hypothetical protein
LEEFFGPGDGKFRALGESFRPGGGEFRAWGDPFGPGDGKFRALEEFFGPGGGKFRAWGDPFGPGGGLSKAGSGRPAGQVWEKDSFLIWLISHSRQKIWGRIFAAGLVPPLWARFPGFFVFYNFRMLKNPDWLLLYVKNNNRLVFNILIIPSMIYLTWLKGPSGHKVLIVITLKVVRFRSKLFSEAKTRPGRINPWSVFRSLPQLYICSAEPSGEGSLFPFNEESAGYIL